MKKIIITVFLILSLFVFAYAAQQSASKTFTVNIVTQLGVSTLTLPNIVVGQAYSAQVTVSGGTPPYTFAVDSTTPLPSGLTLTQPVGNGNAATISGTVTTLPSSCTQGSPCSVNIKINVTDSTP